MELKTLADPTEIIPGSQDIDDEILKLLFNKNKVREWLVEARKDFVVKKKLHKAEYNKEVFKHKKFKDTGLSANSKRKHIEDILYPKWGAAEEEAKNKVLDFQEWHEDIQEVINVYKKLRSFEVR